MSATTQMLARGHALSNKTAAMVGGNVSARDALVAGMAAMMVYAMSQGMCPQQICRDAADDADDALADAKLPMTRKELKDVRSAYQETGDLETALDSLSFRRAPLKMLGAYRAATACQIEPRERPEPALELLADAIEEMILAA